MTGVGRQVTPNIERPAVTEQRATTNEVGIRSGLLTRVELATELEKSTRTLDRWHSQRKGPPRIRIGKTIFFRRESVLAWLEACEEKPAGGRRRG